MKRSLVIIVATCLAGCGEPTVTAGESCTRVAAAGCDQALTCNLTFTNRDLCIDNAVNNCCGAGGCDEAQDADEGSNWATCADDISAQPCEQAGTPPASCVGL